MDKKYILLIIIVIAVAVIGGYFLLNNSSDSLTDSTVDQKTILLSKSAYMHVPDTKNVSDNVDKNGVFYYKNKQDDLNITSCSNLSASSSTKEIKKLKDSVVTGAKKSTEEGIVIYEKNGTYSIFVKNTQYNDTLLIQSSNKNLLLQCVKSVEFHDPAQKIKVNDTGSSSGSVINAAEKTEKAVSTSTSSSSSSSSSSVSSSGSGSGGYSDFGFSSSSSRSSGSSQSSGSGGGGYSDFGF